MSVLFLIARAAAEDWDAGLDLTPDRAPGSLAGGSVHGAEDLRLRYYRSPDTLPGFEDRAILDYVELVERLDLAGGNEHWQAAGRVDLVGLFGNRYLLDDVLYHERDLLGPGLLSPWEDAYVVLEKVSLQHRGTLGTFTIGDSYVSFGRGYALNLVKNTDIDIDTSLRGVDAVVQAGNWDITVASGLTNPQQVALENPNVALDADVPHAVTGVSVDRYGLGPLHIGAHGVMVQYARDVAPSGIGLATYDGAIDAIVAGVTAEAMGLGGLDLFFEGDHFQYHAEEIPVKSGYAFYASAAAYPGIASVLVEARASKNAEYVNTLARNYEIASGPTLEYERVITEDSSAAVNSNDIVGGRTRVDFRLGAGETTLLPYLSFAVFRDSDLEGVHFNAAPETIAHPIAGVQYISGEFHTLLNVGQRVDMRDDGLGQDMLTHADVDLSIPISGPFSLELAPAVSRFHWGDNAVQQEDYVDFSNALALKVGAPWAFILYTDYTTNPLIASTGNLADPLYGAFEVQWKPSPATTLKAFYGAYRAGIRCAGGQCRSLPGFEGARISLTSAF